MTAVHERDRIPGSGGRRRSGLDRLDHHRGAQLPGMGHHELKRLLARGFAQLREDAGPATEEGAKAETPDHAKSGGLERRGGQDGIARLSDMGALERGTGDGDLAQRPAARSPARSMQVLTA